MKSKMPKHEFIVADATAHRGQLIELNVEYLSWVFPGIEDLFALHGFTEISGGLILNVNAKSRNKI